MRLPWRTISVLLFLVGTDGAATPLGALPSPEVRSAPPPDRRTAADLAHALAELRAEEEAAPAAAEEVLWA